MSPLVRTPYDPLRSTSGKSPALLAQKSLVVVDSQLSDYLHLKSFIEEQGFDFHFFQSGSEFLYHSFPDSMICSLVNLDLSDMSGLELCASIRDRNPRRPLFLVANQYDAKLESKVLVSGLGQFVCKPIHPLWFSDCFSSSSSRLDEYCNQQRRDSASLAKHQNGNSRLVGRHR